VHGGAVVVEQIENLHNPLQKKKSFPSPNFLHNSHHFLLAIKEWQHQDLITRLLRGLARRRRFFRGSCQNVIRELFVFFSFSLSNTHPKNISPLKTTKSQVFKRSRKNITINNQFVQ